MSEPIQLRVKKVLQAKKWKVLRILAGVQNFPKFMPNVKQCTVLERKPEGVVTAWSVEVDKIPLSWKELASLDVKNSRLRFRAIEGDLECFEGEWNVKDAPGGGVEVSVDVKVRIGIPLVEQVIGNVLAAKIKKNFELMITAIEERLTMQRYKNIGLRKTSDLKGFAVIGHPYNLQHLIRYFKFFKPDFKQPTQEFLLKIFDLTPSYKSYDVKDFRSKTGKTSNGYFIMCPIIPDMLLISPDRVVEKVAQACKIAEELGVGIVTLGGFTSIAGEKYNKPLTGMINVPVTTGNTFTVALTLDGITKAARLLDLDMSKAKVTVIGGAGDIGSAAARILSETVQEITLTGRSEKNLMEAERVLSYYGKAKIKTSLNNNEAVRGADIVIAAASSSSTIIDFVNFKSGAIVCDIGYPKNISYTACDRKDILIFSGGICSIPSEFNLGFDVGLPSTHVLYGCFAEAIILDLEERYENFSWGKGNITKERVEFFRGIAQKHGFELAPFFWGNKLLTEQDLERIKAEMKEVAWKNAH